MISPVFSLSLSIYLLSLFFSLPRFLSLSLCPTAQSLATNLRLPTVRPPNPKVEGGEGSGVQSADSSRVCCPGFNRTVPLAIGCCLTSPQLLASPSMESSSTKFLQHQISKSVKF